MISYLRRVAVDQTLSFMIKLGAVVLFTPAFLMPTILLAVTGGFLGNVYMKAQLSIKREMANAKAPVLGVFGASMAGLSESPTVIKVAILSKA